MRERSILTMTTLVLVAGVAGYVVSAPTPAHAAYCEGASRITCYPGKDDSGRPPQALLEAAQEGLREARTAQARALAKQAIKEATAEVRIGH